MLENNIRVLVPFSGFLYLYMYIDYVMFEEAKTFSSPSRGSYISTDGVVHWTKFDEKFSSPSRGSYISTLDTLQMYSEETFSSPSRGSYISTDLKLTKIAETKMFSSPSRGSYISTTKVTGLNIIEEIVLVPFSGFLYLYNNSLTISPPFNVLVPFSGFLYLYVKR